MPSALESLVKVLKLERENGFDNKAVIGGLAAYGENWMDMAHDQARIPEHHILVDELVDLTKEYESLDDFGKRIDMVSYMLDRIMGRVPPPEEYAERLDKYEQQMAEEQAAEADEITADEPDEPDDSAAEPPPPRDNRERRQERPKKERAPKPQAKERDSGNRDYSGNRDSGRSARPGGYDDSYDWAFEPPPRGRRPQMDLPPEPRLERPPRSQRHQMDAQEATDVIRGLDASVTTVKGVGPRLQKSLDNLGIGTINDLLFYLPRRYDDYTRLVYISKLTPGMRATVIGTIRNPQVKVGRTGRKDFYFELDDGSGLLPVTFFGQFFLSKQLRKGKQVVVSGKLSFYRDRPNMANPEWEELDRDSLQSVGIVPVYGLTEGLGAKRMRSLMRDTVTYWSGRLPDYMPLPVLERAELADLGWAIQQLHFPDGQDHLHHARRRYMFDQLMLLQMAILANRREWQAVPGQPLDITDDFLEGFVDTVFPYPLTGAQRRAIDDIRRDLAKDVPMNRLLQGDVGSGKTAVAVTALAMAVSQGKQGALMAPTGILAEQHYRGISRTLEAFPGEQKPVIALLTSSLNTTERQSVYRGLADGSIDIVIGTHALIQEGVEFNDLAVAVIDEQHRFGVEQRGMLRGKGNNPHLLVMTATPIPRTLALTLYADLDLSIMDEMPPGRTPIQTRIVLPGEREAIYNFIEGEIKKGRQTFMVHPLVEASEKVEAASAVEAFERLSQVFFRYRVCLLHGKMKPAEKDEIMAAFANHEYDIMVTTSVAEVGVDIPNASVIAIEGANRFGLAQLHQFRGRVGRGEHASYCLLIPDDTTPETPGRLDKITLADIDNNDYPESERRLRAMELSTDGFKLAEIDWKLRGAGDLVGTRQSGRNRLQIAELMTPDLVALAQQEAKTLYADDPYLEKDEHHLLKERVDMLYHPDSDVS